MKKLLCLSLIVGGLLGFDQPAEGSWRRGNVRAVPRSIAYESNRPNATVQLVQLALQRRGYYPGVTTGEFVFETRTAIKRYRRDHGLRVHGRIDRPLLRSLGIR